MYHTHFIFFQGLGQEFGRENNSGSVYYTQGWGTESKHHYQGSLIWVL